MSCRSFSLALLLVCGCAHGHADAPSDLVSLAPLVPLVSRVDLGLGESSEVRLTDGTSVSVKLVDVRETIGSVNTAIRRAEVDLLLNQQPVTLACGNYNLPRTHAGVQIACSVTRGYAGNAVVKKRKAGKNVWALDKDARLRLWPVGSPWIAPGTFTYPARQKWFATMTQMGNEPVYVDGGDSPDKPEIYYHYGMDIGGSEGLVDVVAATDGIVVTSGDTRLPGHEAADLAARYDVVYLVDRRGWYYRYSHLQTIESEVRVGATVRQGQKLGLLGKEGGSGGWSHLHFDITVMQPSGRYGIEDAYPYIWQAYQSAHAPPVTAVARPHHAIQSGETVTLDAGHSHGENLSFEWTFGDGSQATGATVDRTYQHPGAYSEILRVKDAHGNVSHDFAVVQVIDGQNRDRVPGTINATYAPTLGVRVGSPLRFKVRTFRTGAGPETWDMGDGTPPRETRSEMSDNHNPRGYAELRHIYVKPGTYVVRVSAVDAHGNPLTTHLAVTVQGL